MASSLIPSIHSALHNMNSVAQFYASFELKIELRNLNTLLIIVLRKSGDAHFLNSSSTLPSIFSRIQDGIEKICLLETTISYKDGLPYTSWIGKIAEEIHCLGKEDEEWYTVTGGPLLTVDDVVAIADSIIGNCLDFPYLLSYSCQSRIKVKVIDAFEVQIQFLKNFLVFANHYGVQLHGLLILIQPIAINAARVFVKDRYTMSNTEWIEQVHSNCSMLNDMATKLQNLHAYTQALSTLTKGPQCVDMDDGILKNILDSLISLLWDVLRYSDSCDSSQDEFIALYARLRSCRAILKQESIRLDGKIMHQIGGMVRDAGLLTCSLHQTDVKIDAGRISSLLQGFDAIEAQVCSQTSKSNELDFGDHSTNMNIFHGDQRDLKVHEGSPVSSHQPPQCTSTPQVVGFQDDEVNSVMDQLTRGTNQLRIVLIYGMAGTGKTTFALSRLYNHRTITYHFQARAWCTVSQVLDKKKLLVQLLNQIQKPCSYSGMTEDDLADTLRRRLKGKRYLILLDDVWTLQVWNSLQTSFPDDYTRSRIILTSRHCDISPHGLLYGKPYLLRLREDSECLEILQLKLSCEEGWNPVIGKEIAKLCKGLPLMVSIVAGLLATVKEQGWKGILDHLRSGGVSREEQFNNALELSFKHLPDDLKLCFLYFGAFREDAKIYVKRLIRLWMAEGLVKNNGLKTSEDVGREYLENLIQRSLVMVTQSRSMGGVKRCQIHDLLHDFCVTKARQGNSFHRLHGYKPYNQLSDFNQPCCLQRLCIYCRPMHFKNSKLFCPSARSLLLFCSQFVWNDPYYFDLSFIIQVFKLLKVVDMSQFGLVAEIPSEIELLTRLTYLSVQCRWAVIPFSIGNLSNLETLIVDSPRSVEVAISFPETLWKLKKLKYLEICWQGGFVLPIENHESSSDLLKLVTLSGVVFDSDGSMEEQLKKFQNIRRLKCTVESALKLGKMVIPDSLSQLRSLNVSGYGKLQCKYGSTQKLRKLKLAGFEMSREDIGIIGKLPKLEVLKLANIFFSEGTLAMEEGDFSKLKLLELFDIIGRFKRWTAFDEQLPCLQKLTLSFCCFLKEIPSTCLETSLTLEEIEVYQCSSALESLVREIEAVHRDYGNFVNVVKVYSRY